MKKLLIVAAIIFCAAGVSQAVMIDDFTDITGSSYIASTYACNPDIDYTPIYALGIKTDVRTGSSIIGGTCNVTWNAIASYPLFWIHPCNTCFQVDNTGCIAYRTGILEYAGGSGRRATITLEYGKNSNLNADLVTGGGTRIELEEWGDIDTSNKFVPCTITITSGKGTGSGEKTATVTKNIINDGFYYFNYSEFTGVNFSDVDYILVKFDMSTVNQNSVDFMISSIQTNQTTLVELTDFQAIPGNGKVVLNWATATETDNAGFNILRAESENGEYAKINDAIIPAKAGATEGASYQFIDSNATNRTTYYYKLEDIDLNGTATMHGPKSATPKWIFGLFGK